MIKGKKILLCVSGGIAVYKAAALTSKLVQNGAEVKVIMTESARKFVAPLTFQALSRHDVYWDTFDEKDSSKIAHIDLADWADLVLVAPATANIIGKLANGIADDMISTTILATTAKVWIAPAMNVHMYDHPAVKRNIETLFEFGYRFVEPSEGYLACGYVGKGRLEEPEKVVELVDRYFSNRDSERKILQGKKVVITAGPTREMVDPVRFFSNRSTGKMGYALAEAAVSLGAEVVLISGPSQLPVPSGIEFVSVTSAEEMYNAVHEAFPTADIVVKSAAVADYRPKETFEDKLKKKEGNLVIEFERTKDILMSLGERKKHQYLIGFAAETSNVYEYAKAKLEKKRANMIVANNVKETGSGFGTDTNKVSIVTSEGSILELPLLSKVEVAKEIYKEAIRQMKKGSSHERS
ncbi:bifunctional phosphopantothenoylcysteine decarboxylase/phosphopantothenate--cysteine ligase CoaBC [Rossellomorea aquimaris]|uniref:Coenzyme A biosynthesis bifunctional protein CoaBC n=1 Tax=Rossellomorea aquimaris TaxID=189382 RepID=A0A5D4TZL6_9BACI|nr:bifunctional phosphopantothenoylcysteine decarboxylase/phosphopantothenate--cysteine ligase CoaBC [Rossellomorea aquimaris]TYS80474.1 bifunctional phosphopantothenoylcysteine decarboxylase/phosphopantothenate--cysteine ligase CoaBC [Rossellomorea aquimaris]TYS85860.1 bifunctional phosphopantothenoylcysteine decarboxylase/phosphopantothenate--cysteine ligase CoaBC [Rossellomorea aquimaris]